MNPNGRSVTSEFRSLLLASVLVIASQGSALAFAQGDDASWEDLRTRLYPEWFTNAKLGIFVHWGVYSVPAYSGKEQYGEWFLRGLQLGDTLRSRFLRENYGEQFTYRDFAPLFRAELFDPQEWASLFRRAGARYVVLVSKHHDGYAMWPSRYAPDWNSMEVGPHRDLVGEVAAAVRDSGLKMGLYYSLPEWDNPLHRWDNDPHDSIATYVEEHMIPQFKELICTYRPEVLFADGDWFHTAEQWHARELIDWYFDTIGPEAIVNDRWGSGSDIGFLTPEYSAGIQVLERPWVEVRGLGRSFALNRNEDLDAYMTATELIRRFASAVAAGGGMILNVGPKADGQIPLLQQERLLQLGRWLDVNGKAIYGSKPWTRTGEECEVVLERVDPNIDFDWVRNSPGRPIREDNFQAEWTGFLAAPSSETYVIEIDADDGVRVWLDDELVIDAWDGFGEGAKGSVLLRAGKKTPIRVQYHEVDLEASVRLSWSSPTLPKQIIPQNRFFTSTELTEGDGLNAVYKSDWQYLAYTTNGDDLFSITFVWPDSELALPISEPQQGAQIRLMGVDRDLPWRHTADTLYVDFSGIAVSEMPGLGAWTVRLQDYLARN